MTEGVRPLLLAIVVLVASALPARADEPFARITLGTAGPDQPLPVDAPFFLTGQAAANAVEVQPVLVRYNYSVFGGWPALDWFGGPEDCHQVAEALPANQLKSPAKTPRGRVAIDAVWGRPAGRTRADYDALVRRHEAFVPSPWTRAAGDAGQTFEVMVNAGDFFRPGASYCLMIYERRVDIAEDTTRVQAALIDAARNCGGDVGTCALQVRAAVQRTLSVVDAAQAAAVSKVVDDSLISATLSMLRAGDSLAGRLMALKAAVAHWQPRPYHLVANDPFGALAAAALDAQGELRAIVGADGQLTFRTVDGALAVNAIGLREDDDAIVVANDASPTGADDFRKLTVRASSLKLPDSTVTLRDLALFGRGKVAIGDQVMGVERLAVDGLGGRVQLGDAGPPADADGRVAAMRDLFMGLSRLVDRAQAARNQPPGSRADWMDARLAAWLTVALPDRVPLDAVTETLRDYADGAAAWRAQADALAVTLRTERVTARPVIAQ
ncbi:MAG: hypothetical protein KC620_04525, partial [Myxococcales bacterium]|nr:hypothetical protein [Myxococcales bacterium]